MSQDLNRFFQAEAEDLLGRIASVLERGGAEPVSAEALRELRRWTHTLKGAAQVVRRANIAEGAHQLETVLEGFGDAATQESAVHAARQTLSVIRSMVATSGEGADLAGQASPQSASPAPQPIETLRIELRELDGLLHAVNESTLIGAGAKRNSAELAQAGEIAAMLRAELAGAPADRSSHTIEALTEQIEDMIAQVRRDLESVSDTLTRSLDDLRTRVEVLRLVRGEGILQILEQSVHSASAGSEKLIHFESAGGELEFDVQVLIAARDALIQIVRNAVAHGIESREDRVAHGKPEAGTIRVTFRHEGVRNIFAVQDDGRGIDFEALRTKAVRRGWLTAEEARTADDQELTDLLLRPGVTTAGSANVLSGRGVGLDLVSRTVARLKGDLRVTANPGRGTTFEISVPASLNSIAALIVTAGGKHYGIPREAVRQTVSLQGLDRLADRYVVNGRPLSLVSLSALMGNGASHSVIAAEIAHHSQPFLLGLEAMHGIRQVILHSLPEFVQAEPFVLGASLDAMGQVLPIVTPLMMGATIHEHLRERAAENRIQTVPLPILVVDDSLTTRMLEQSIFEMEGYAVELAGSAEEALEMAMERPYGLFLVDVEMPGMDGVAFVEAIQREAALRDTPAILVTSRGAAEDRARGLKAGAQDYIVKSEFDQRYLIGRVRELIRVRQ